MLRVQLVDECRIRLQGCQAPQVVQVLQVVQVVVVLIEAYRGEQHPQRIDGGSLGHFV